MFTILNIVLPVFAIVGLGYGAVRFGLFPMAGIKGLIAFVNNFAAPCLLFQAMLDVDFDAVFDPRILGGFYAGSFLCFGLGIVLAILVFRASGPRSVVAGISSAFTNALLLGVPITQRAFGDEALPFSYSIIAFQAPLVFTSATIAIEFAEKRGGTFHQTVIAALLGVVTNPLVMGVLSGVVLNLLGVQLPDLIHDSVVLLAGAVLPTALFGLGGALNEYGFRENWRQSITVAGIKLFVHPALAWLIMVPIFGVPLEIARYAIIVAAMPTGFNAYILATRSGRGEDIAANTILITTASAVISVSIWLYVLT